MASNVPSNRTMFSYFTKLPSKTSIVEENPRKSAPVFNKQHVEEFQNRRERFEAELTSDNNTSNYLTTIKSHDHKPFRTYKRSRGSLRARLLQFSEDVRPPYFGTWQKKSKLVTGRKPFSQDIEYLDYENDSEAEWDLGGPGESLKGDDSEDDEELDDYEIDMKTFVPHGYVSDDEIDVHSDNEDESATNRSLEEPEVVNCDGENDDNTNSSVKIVAEVKNNSITDQQSASDQQQQTNQTAPPKQTPKMDLKPITIGLNFEDNSSLSETKLQFLRAFQGVNCT